MFERVGLKVVLAAIAIMAMLVGVFSVIALASGNPSQGDDDQYKLMKERFEQTRKLLEDSHKRYREKLGWFGWGDPKEAYRDYQLNATYSFQAYLEMLRYRLETGDRYPVDVTKRIDKRLKDLEGLQGDIRKAETRRDMMNTTQKLKGLWLNIRLEAKYDIGLLWLKRVDLFLGRMDNISDRIDIEIQRLKDADKDTRELESKLAEFNRLVDLAEKNYKEVKDLYDEHEGFDDSGNVVNATQADQFLKKAYKYMRETDKYLRDAFKVLREIFREIIQERRPEVGPVWGTGSIEARGDGKVVVTGNLTVNVSGGEMLVVSDNAEVTTGKIATMIVLGNGFIKYTDYGNATIKGSNITVEVSGNDIHVNAEGTGSARLVGNGTVHSVNFAVSRTWGK